ncbi:MAG: hypothetical protein IJY39_11580 [Clostridia bacterium]|nr:hypothetical protein [Clostridia bacterium]
MNFGVAHGRRGRRGLRRILAVMLVPFVILLSMRQLCVPTGALDRVAEVTEAMREGFYTFAESIDVSEYGITSNELTQLFATVIKDDPYLFYVDTRLSYSYRRDGCVISLKPLYTMSPSEVEAAWLYCRDRVREIANLACGDEVERALWLHDYICQGFSYDDSLQNHSMYEMLRTGKGTCQAYTHLYIALLREVGIESHFVASDSLAHIWNLVRIGGLWYHTDLTWDDSASQETVSRRHFLLSDAAAIERGHGDWYSPIEVVCLSELYRDVDFDAMLSAEALSGDVDHNGQVDLADLLALRIWLKDASGKLALTAGFCVGCADLDQNGVAADTDVILLRRKLLQGN